MQPTIFEASRGNSSSRPRMRVGIVGCGRVSETCHLPALRSLAGHVVVTAIADPDEHRRRRVAGMFDIARSSPDVESMLRVSGDVIDAIAICTPASGHADAVVAALEAGKHVLIEKPLALTLDDADRIVSAVSARPDVKAMVGFNLRHHRLVQRAKKMIASGTIGDVQLLRTVWTASIRNRMTLPAWRNRRESGGGVLSEIAVHHVDLIRYLTDSEIEQVFAICRHGASDDESASATFRLNSGATVASTFSESTSDANELELFGPAGRIAFSVYQFDSLVHTSPANYGGRARRIAQTLKDLREYWPILRRGGDFRETYRRQWIAFIDAIRQDREVPATVQDGREALRVILAAQASDRRGVPVDVSDAPRAPVSVEGRASISEPEHLQEKGAAQLSAIITTRGAFSTIRRTVEHLRAQTVHDRIELLIVCPIAARLGMTPDDLSGFHSHQIIEVNAVASVAQTNAVGVRSATAPLAVFCEDHAFPDPSWAESLIIAHSGPYAVVGPAVHNANPTTLVSQADCLIGYGPWHEPVRPCEPAHLPGHNSCYKREILLGYGDRLEAMLDAETVMHWDLRARGQRLYLDPRVRLAHTNFARFGVWTKVQFHAGRMFAATRAANWPVWKRFVFACTAGLIPLVRFRRVMRDARRASSSRLALLRVLPVVAWGLLIDGLGQFVGTASGSGASRRLVGEYEFERVRYISELDRQALGVNQEVVA